LNELRNKINTYYFSVINTGDYFILTKVLSKLAIHRLDLAVADKQRSVQSEPPAIVPKAAAELKKLSRKAEKSIKKEQKNTEKYFSHLFAMTISSSLHRHRKEQVKKDVFGSIKDMLSLEHKEKKTKIKNSIFKRAGYKGLSSSMEYEYLKKILKNNEFTNEDKDKLESYVKGLERSRKFNLALNACETSRYADETLVNKDLSAVSSELMKEIGKLKNGESFFLDVGHTKHAMRLIVKRENEHIHLSLVDSSGALDRVDLLKSRMGILKILEIESGRGGRHMALSFKVPIEDFNVSGQKYFVNLFKLNTKLSKNKEKEKIEKLKNSVSHSIFPKLNEYKLLVLKWENTFNTFAAIAPHQPKMTDQIETQQIIGNCYAKRLQANQVMEMGKPLHKKVRLALLENSVHEIIDKVSNNQIITEQEVQKLKSITPKLLSEKEIKSLKNKLLKINSTPQSYAEWRNIIIYYHHQIEMMKVERIDKRDITTKVVKNKLSSNSITADALKKAKVVNIYNSLREKTARIGIEINGKTTIITQKKFFILLAKHPSLLESPEIKRLLAFLNRPNVLEPKAKERFDQLIAVSQVRP
jgi:hypothetical protein